MQLGCGRVQLKCDVTRRTGEVKGRLSNGVDITSSTFYKFIATFRTHCSMLYVSFFEAYSESKYRFAVKKNE